MKKLKPPYIILDRIRDDIEKTTDTIDKLLNKSITLDHKLGLTKEQLSKAESKLEQLKEDYEANGGIIDNNTTRETIYR